MAAAVIDGGQHSGTSRQLTGRRYDSGIYLQYRGARVHGHRVANGPSTRRTACAAPSAGRRVYPWLMAALFGHLGVSQPAAGMGRVLGVRLPHAGGAWVLIGPELDVLEAVLPGLARRASRGWSTLYALFPVSLARLPHGGDACCSSSGGTTCWRALSVPCAPGRSRPGHSWRGRFSAAVLLVERGPRCGASSWRGGGRFGGCCCSWSANRLWSGSWSAYFSTPGQVRQLAP